jgi:hypothetical protein
MIAAKIQIMETQFPSKRSVARSVGITHTYINHASIVLEYAPDLADQVIAGKVSRFDQTTWGYHGPKFFLYSLYGHLYSSRSLREASPLFGLDEWEFWANLAIFPNASTRSHKRP